MKKFLCIAAALLLTISLCGCSGEEKYPDPTSEFYVNDFAGVMDEEDKAAFLSKAVALNKATTAQVVIVTVDDLGGDEPAEYAVEIGRKWGVGDAESDNGVVILLSENDREIYIGVGYGLEGAIPDLKADRIIEVYGLESLRNNDFSTGLASIAGAVVNEVYIEYGLQPESGYVSLDQMTVTSGADGISVAGSWVIMLVILAIVSLLSRKFGWGWIMFFLSPRGYRYGGFHNDNFRGGGGFSGGGFSGGGGSFGGGGAGRGF